MLRDVQNSAIVANVHRMVQLKTFCKQKFRPPLWLRQAPHRPSALRLSNVEVAIVGAAETTSLGLIPDMSQIQLHADAALN